MRDADDRLAGLQFLAGDAPVHVALDVERRHVVIVRVGEPDLGAQLLWRDSLFRLVRHARHSRLRTLCLGRRNGYGKGMAEGTLHVRGSMFIRESDLAERFVATGGPGGQAVNKLATGVQLRYAPRTAQTLPWSVIVKAEKLAGSKLNVQGEIVISATRHRSQDRNRADARERLLELLREAAAPPPKKRRPTRPSLSAKRKRTDTKVKRGTTKRLRGKPTLD